MKRLRPHFNVEKFVRFSEWKSEITSRVFDRHPELKGCCSLEVQPSRGPYLMHVLPTPYTRTNGFPKRATTSILEFMGRFQQEVFRHDQKPPKKAELVYWGSWINPNSISAYIGLPHSFSGIKIPEKVESKNLKVGNLTVKLVYWEKSLEKLIKKLVEELVDSGYGHIFMNTPHESLALTYFFKHHLGGEQVPLVRSITFFDKNGNVGEFDGIAVRRNNHKPEVHLVEAKTANVDPMSTNWKNIVASKVATHLPFLRKLRNMGIPVQYHWVLTGVDEEMLRATIPIVKSALEKSKDTSVVLHGVLAGKRLVPLYVKRI